MKNTWPSRHTELQQGKKKIQVCTLQNKMSQISEKTTNPNIPTKKTSIVWLYFVETYRPDKLKCIKCNKLCAFKRKSTGNLMRHMRLRHPDLYAAHAMYPQNMSNLDSQGTSQLQSQSISQNENAAPANEITKENNQISEDEVQTMEIIQHENITETVEPSSVVEEQNLQPVAYYLIEQTEVNQAKEINNQILKLIVKQFYNINLVENKEFISFINMLNSNYALPNSQSLSDDLLLKTYETKVQQLKSTLKEVKYLALTIDRWMSIEDDNFIAVTAHYLKKDLTLQSSFLDCISFHKDSSINIPIFLQELIGNWRVSDKIVAVVTENDPVIVNAIKECQWQHISCFSHTLNKIIITSLQNINDVLVKVRNIVNHFKRNSNAMAELQNYQNEIGITNMKLKKDNPNRWNSTFDMIRNFLKNKEILKTQLIKNLPNELSFDDWLILENAVKLLIVFNTITVEICSEKVVSLSKVPYMIRFMMKHVTNLIENMQLPSKMKIMGQKLNEELIQQSKIIETNDIICQSVLLDPRFKKRGFPENSFNAAYSSLLKNVILLKNEKMHEFLTTQHGKQQNTQEYFIDVWTEFRDTEKLPKKDFTSDATAEIDAFLGEAYVSMKDNPVTYWGNDINQNKFPALFELVKSRLCVPATSVPCKNAFSKVGNALIERRNFLPKKYIKEILFLHHNL